MGQTGFQEDSSSRCHLVSFLAHPVFVQGPINGVAMVPEIEVIHLLGPLSPRLI